jgi:hypothetical protein
MRRRHRPARRQLMLVFLAALGYPLPSPVVAGGRAPAPRPSDRPSWRPRRARNQTRPREGTMARKVDRFVRRGAHCCLCRTWPAPVESWVDGRITLTCRACAWRPSTAARLEEIAVNEWN